MASIRRVSKPRRPNEEIRGYLSRRFAVLRIKRGASQQVVSANSGLAVSFISDFENEKRGISTDNWCNLIAALAYDPAKELGRALANWGIGKIERP